MHRGISARGRRGDMSWQAVLLARRCCCVPCLPRVLLRQEDGQRRGLAAASSGKLEAMAKEWARAFYDSAAWEETRAAYIRSVGGLCEECRRQGRITPGRIVHHKQHLTPETIRDPAVSLSFLNLELLCIDCHNAVHGYGPRAPYKWTPDGRMVPR